jgi:hypothetical protein
MGKYLTVRAGKLYEPKVRKDSVEQFVSYIPAPVASAAFSSLRFTKSIDLNLEPRISKALGIASRNVVAEANRLLPKAMQASSWGFTGGSRDIIDTGQLMKSMNVTISGSSVQVSYDEPYAALVHYGGYIQPYGNRDAAPMYLPGRPWVQAVLTGGGPVESIDYESIYRDAFAQVFG